MIYSADREKIKKNRRRKGKETERRARTQEIHRGREKRQALFPCAYTGAKVKCGSSETFQYHIFIWPGTAVIKAMRVSLKGLARTAPHKKAVIEGILMVSVA